MALAKTIFDKTKEILGSDITKAVGCGALFLASPSLPVLASVAALAGAIGTGYFTGKHIQKKTLLKTLEAGKQEGSVPRPRKRQR